MRPLFPKKPQPKVLTTSEFSRATGATLRQLQWWDERRILIPDFHGPHPSRRSGSVRLYSRDQLRMGKLLVRVSGSGLRMSRFVAGLKKRRIQRLERYVVWNHPEYGATVEVFTFAEPGMVVDLLVRKAGGWSLADVGGGI